ncbi:aldo/keto reductase [Microbacterium sp.]|uniref:aldo/keto reductase n=1 Tax=Microbacterium sp. TaxID=51671 RepID=UPI003C788068
MRLFSNGTAERKPRPEVALDEHPSAPIPVIGPGVGESIRVPLGETGFSVFPLMLGAAEFGWNVDLPTSHALLDRYLEYGGNAIHTADGFSGGRSEHIIGQWLRSRGTRDRVVLSVRVGSHADNPGLGSVNLVRAVEGSLTRLGADRIDVLYLDASLDDDATNLEDTLATVEWLRDAGKISAVGGFRFAPERLVEARILASAGYPRLDVLDEPYNLVRRQGFEGDLRLVADAQSLAVTPSHALEHGFLSGRHRSRAAVAGVRGQQLRSQLNRRGIRVLRALDLVAAELAVPVAAVSIGWLLAQRTIVAPIVNAFAEAHVEELMQGAGITLSRTQLAELSRAGA